MAWRAAAARQARERPVPGSLSTARKQSSRRARSAREARRPCPARFCQGRPAAAKALAKGPLGEKRPSAPLSAPLSVPEDGAAAVTWDAAPADGAAVFPGAAEAV